MRFGLVLVVLAACKGSSGPSPGPASSSPVMPSSSVGSVRVSTAPAASATTTGDYPVGKACAAPDAIAKEGRSLPRPEEWQTIVSSEHRLRVRVPTGAFVRSADGPSGLELTSSSKARGLGPDAKDRPFAIRFERLARSADAVLADKSKGAPLESANVEEVFPKRTVTSFVPHPSAPNDPIHSGFSGRATVAGRSAYVWVTGAEGYNTDQILVPLGPDEVLHIAADWNSSVMAGQPECWQRAVIGGVVESLVLDGDGGSPSSTTLSTLAGDLVIETHDPLRESSLLFRGKRVLGASDDYPKDPRAVSPMLSFIRTFGPMGGFDDVVLLRWDGPGNACSGYALTFVGLKEDGTSSPSSDISWCGGPQPVVTTEGTAGPTRIVVTFPKHPPNRGTGVIPEAVWIYEAAHGAVRKK